MSTLTALPPVNSRPQFNPCTRTSHRAAAADTRPPESSGQTRVLIADDHPIVRKGIVACLSGAANILVVGEAQNGAEALKKTQELHPDVVLLDIDMPHLSGLAVVEQFRHRFPGTRVIMLSMHNRSEFILRAIQAGARGYMLKGSSAVQLAEAVRKVHGGECFFSKEVTGLALNCLIQGHQQENDSQLTAREREVLVQIAEGLSNKEIAWLLSIGVRTVETHRERIMRKLDIHSIAGLTKYAITHGLISTEIPQVN